MLLMQHFYDDDDRRQYFLYESMLLDNVGYIGLEVQCHRNGYNSVGPNWKAGKRQKLNQTTKSKTNDVNYCCFANQRCFCNRGFSRYEQLDVLQGSI